VIAAVDEPVDATRCNGQRNCHDSKRCLTHDLWEDLSREIKGFLDSISLEQLIQVRDGETAARPPQDGDRTVVPIVVKH
jgi:Rrf2 family iron-sulfur cluster assembly transcriptional regulator